MTSLEQLTDLLAAGADSVLLDNMDCDEMREAVAVNAGRAKLEASGGLTIERAREVARPGSTTSRCAPTHPRGCSSIAMDLRVGTGRPTWAPGRGSSTRGARRRVRACGAAVPGEA